MRFIRLFIIGILCLFVVFAVRADEEADIKKQLDDAFKILNTQQANKQALVQQLSGVKERVGGIEQEIVKKEQEVALGEKALAKQTVLLNERARSYYKNVTKNNLSLVDLLIAENLSESLKSFFYQKTVVDEDKNTIVKIVLYVKNLEVKKAELEQEKIRLAQLKVELDKQTKSVEADIAKTQSTIAELSARQQQLIAQKQASLNIPRSAGTSARGCSSDLTNGKDPGFSPRVGFFSYGAPHRNGLNQYGAWGRAKAGQNEEQILSEYYPGLSLKKDYDQNTQVNVEGYGTFSIEDYTKRIYEVPDSWTDNNLAVLKAQAVAARTYALNTMQRRGSICTTEACQVFKPEPKGGNWEQAVSATAGWVLMDGGSPGFTQYASTHGGYILNLGKFDGSGGNPGSFAELNERAYDKESPWFYCNWGSRAEYGGTAWMKPEEVADIFNVIELARRDSGVKDKLYQPDKPHPYGGEVWGIDRVKQELRARGGTPVDSVTDVSLGVDFGSGKTTSVSGGGISASGSEFKDWFNLRAPANIQIVGPLFNVEKR